MFQKCLHGPVTGTFFSLRTRSRPHLSNLFQNLLLVVDAIASSSYKNAHMGYLTRTCCLLHKLSHLQPRSVGYVYVMVWPALHVNVSGFSQFFNRLTASHPKRTVSGVSVSKLTTQERPVSAACSGRLKLQVMKWEWPNTPHTQFSPFSVRKFLLQSFWGRIFLLFFCRNCIYCLFLKALLIMCLK